MFYKYVTFPNVKKKKKDEGDLNTKVTIKLVGE